MSWFDNNWQGLAVAAVCFSTPLLWLLVFYIIRGHIHNVRAGIRAIENISRTSARTRSAPRTRPKPMCRERRETQVLRSPFDLKINERIENGRLERWTPLRGWHALGQAQSLEDHRG